MSASSLALPWLRAGVFQGPSSYRGTSITGIVLPVALASLGSLFATSVWATGQGDGWRQFALIAAAVAAVIGALFLLSVESASALLPNHFLPRTIRRTEFGLRAGPGPWVCLGGAGLSCACLSIDWKRARMPGGLLQHPDFPMAATLVVALASLGLLLGWLRYKGWAVGSAAGTDVEFEGWLIPGAGVLSLIALWGVVVAGAAVVALRFHFAAMAAAFSGWLATVGAALTIVSSGALAKIRFDSIAPTSIRRYTPHLHTSSNAWAAYGVGLAIAGCGFALLARRRGGVEL